MKRTHILALLLALLLPLQATAQKGRKATATNPKKKAQAAATTKEDEDNPLREQMLTAVERIVVVDSSIVAQSQVLAALYSNPEEGRIMPSADFVKGKASERGYAYMNELGSHCIFAKADAKGGLWLYSSDKLGEQWSEPERLKGLDGNNFKELNYPYLMTDGVTLYFAARGDESLGGYDIYRTRLNTETGEYLKPENIGMPYNSEADDFFYVIDEQNRLGYFATTRRQAKGKVCVYTFVPNEARTTYDAENMDEEQLKRLGSLHRIADTWGKGSARKEALARMVGRSSAQSNTTQPQDAQQEGFEFVINDQTVYTKLSDFRQPALARQWQELRAKAKELDASLQRMRSAYAKASADERRQMKAEILTCEQRLEALQAQRIDKEKEIRKAENPKEQ